MNFPLLRVTKKFQQGAATYTATASVGGRILNVMRKEEKGAGSCFCFCFCFCFRVEIPFTVHTKISFFISQHPIHLQFTHYTYYMYLVRVFDPYLRGGLGASKPGRRMWSWVSPSGTRTQSRRSSYAVTTNFDYSTVRPPSSNRHSPLLLPSSSTFAPSPDFVYPPGMFLGNLLQFAFEFLTVDVTAGFLRLKTEGDASDLRASLEDALFQRKCPDLFDCRQRFSVAVGIARGLEYLHCLDLLGIHDDGKPSNVLLD
ncbi:Receptor-like serine/threonine-protein kinase At4g25390 [Linum perenne]